MNNNDCPICGYENSVTNNFCRKCGTKLINGSPETTDYKYQVPLRRYKYSNYEFPVKENVKYKALRQIAEICNYLSLLVFILSIGIAIFFIWEAISLEFYFLFISIGIFIIGGFFSVILKALAESIFIIIDIEDNTYRTAEAMENYIIKT